MTYRNKKMKRQSNQKRPENAGKCICESLEFQNFLGGMLPDPPKVEGPLGLRKIYPSVILNYPLVQKFIETPDKLTSVLDVAQDKQGDAIKGTHLVFFQQCVSTGLIVTKVVIGNYPFHHIQP